MNLSYLSGAFIIGAFLTLLLGVLTAIGVIPVFLFNITPRGYLTFTYTALMFAITLMLWEMRSKVS